MTIFLTLIALWFVTWFFYLFHKDKHNWAGIMSVLSVFVSIYEFNTGSYILASIWAFNSIVWWNTRKKRLLLKKMEDEQKEKGN